MTVQRGGVWGTEATAPAEAFVAGSDAELAGVLSGGVRPVVVRGGDLHRSLGSPEGEAVTRKVPIDLIAVAIDGRRLVAVAHVIARRRGRSGWWRGSILAVMNVDHLGDWDAAPRAHPNDGWLDVIDVGASMSLRSRWQAWQRLRTGSHVPHPEIATRRIRSETFTFANPIRVWVDGIDRGAVRSLRVEVEPDRAEVYV